MNGKNFDLNELLQLIIIGLWYGVDVFFKIAILLCIGSYVTY